MRKVIISHDYDGCFDIMTPEGLELAINGPNKASWDKYTIETGATILDLITAARDQHERFLRDLTKDADEVLVYVGSDRQSYELDQLNQKAHHNGSVFPALEELCRTYTTAIQKWSYATLLMADPLISGKGPFRRERGTAYKLIQLKDEEKQLVVNEPPLRFKNEKGVLCRSKIPMLLNQMWDAYYNNPDATELQFHFIDDREDLIMDVLSKLNPVYMPPKMTLTASRFDHVGVMTKDDDRSHQVYGTIVSKARGSGALVKFFKEHPFFVAVVGLVAGETVVMAKTASTGAPLSLRN